VNPLRAFSLIFERERTRFSLWLPVALACGVVAYFSLPYEPPLWELALTPALGLAAWLFQKVFWPLAVVLFAACFISLGFSASKVETLLDRRPMLSAPLSGAAIKGRVLSTDLLPDGFRITLFHPTIGSLRREATPEKIRVSFDELTFDEAPPTGAEIAFLGNLNAFSEPVAPHAADFRRIAYFNHIGALGWSRDPIVVLDPSPKDYAWSETFSLMLERTRKTLARHVYKRLSGDVAAVTAARLNGEQTAITAPVMEAMRVSGLAHLLATSGANVTIMGLLIYFPLRALLALIPWVTVRFNIKKWAALGAVFSALAFTFLVGSQAATMRSMIMVGIAMTAIMLDRHTDLLRLVMLSALLSMIFAPSATLGPSFQMSFAAVFALVATSRMPDADFMGTSSFSRFFGNIGGIVRTSIIATAATTPFSIYHFQTFNLYGALSNTLAIPLASFWVMPFTILAYLTAPFGCDGLFIDMAGLGNALTIRIAMTVAGWPYSVLSWPAMPDAALVAIIFGGFWLCLWREAWRYFGVVPIMIGMAYPLYTTLPDFFVSPSGTAWGARLRDGRLAVSNVKREKFAVSQWKRRLGNVDVIDAYALPSDQDEIGCDLQGCVFRRKDFGIALPSVGEAAFEDCRIAAIVVAPFMINACSAETIIDRKALDKHGAYTFYFQNDGVQIIYDHEDGALRPWSLGYAPLTALRKTSP